MANITKDFIVKSTIDIPFPKCDLWTYLEKSFQQNGDKIALSDPEEKLKLTFAETQDLAETIASNLLGHGYNPDIPVCMYMSNCVELILISLAVWRLGGTVSSINHLLLPGEIRKFIKMINADILFCNEVTVVKATEAAKGTSVKRIFSIEDYNGCHKLSTLYSKDNKIFLPRNTFDPKVRVASMPFSSGTTGSPKAVEITHSALVEQTSYFNYVTQLETSSTGGVIYLPLSHSYGIEIFIAHLACGTRSIIMPQFDMEQYIALVAKYRIEKLFFVPPVAVKLSKSDLAKRYDISHVKVISIGAAPLSKHQEKELYQAIGHKPRVIQIYGLTEATCLITAVPEYACDINCPQGSVGLPLPNTWLKVKDDAGANLGPNQLGELCVKCGYVMKGYLQNPEATMKAFEDGWLCTGDSAYYDEKGCFFIVDRLKEFIKYQGFQVAPSELEGILLTHPNVADAAVTSLPDDAAGELPYAWIVVKAGRKCSEQELLTFVNDRVASFKRLRGGIKFVAEIPKSPSGKILRKLIREKIKHASKL